VDCQDYGAMEYPTCDFCNELNGRPGDLFTELLSGEAISRVIARRGELRVLPSLGEMLPGHLLIVPTYHVTASTALRHEEKKLLTNLLWQIREIFSSENGELPTCFEHGDPAGSEVFTSQCVSHAHIHVLPISVNMLPILRVERPFLCSAPIGDTETQIDQPYVSVLGTDQQIHYFSAIGAPRQFMRALYARLIGKPSAEEWFARVDITKTLKSIDKYGKLFKELG
jgi:diadenosine tetraphosphate (Ap4A) HIT family hydrolase